MHTGYIATVAFAVHPSRSWQMITRYATYYNFYCKFHKELSASTPRGMLYPFPNDRIKTRFFGVNDETRNLRQKGLDLWLREICMNPRVMLDLKLRSAFYDLLDVHKNKALLDSAFASSVNSSRVVDQSQVLGRASIASSRVIALTTFI